MGVVGNAMKTDTYIDSCELCYLEAWIFYFDTHIMQNMPKYTINSQKNVGKGFTEKNYNKFTITLLVCCKATEGSYIIFSTNIYHGKACIDLDQLIELRQDLLFCYTRLLLVLNATVKLCSDHRFHDT